MKKILKVGFVLVIVAVIGLLAINVLADTTPKVKKYLRFNSASAVLYTDNKLYLWGKLYNSTTNNVILENIKDIVETDNNDLLIIDLENNLKLLREITVYNEELELHETFFDISNIPDVLANNIKIADSVHFLTQDNKLYRYSYNAYSDDIDFEQKLIAEDVKTWSWSYNYNSYLILDTENKLYAYGTNIYGKKINDGNNIIEEPILIAENVKEFSNISENNISHYPTSNGFFDYRLLGNFYLTNDNKLYLMSSNLPYPKLIKSDVSKFLYNKYYIKDGKTYYLYYNITEDQIVIQRDELIFDEELEYGVFDDFRSSWYLTKNGNLYNNNYDKKMIRVKQISYVYSSNHYVLKENGDLIEINSTVDYTYDKIEIRQNKVLSNVKKMINDIAFIMEDDTIYVGGSANHDIADFNGTEASYYKNYAIIKGLPNVQENVNVSQVVLNNVAKTDFTVGDSYDFYSYVYPSNAENTEVIWESSNEEVVTVNQKGTLSFHKPGTATIRVKSASTNHSDEIEITVHPKNSSIEILGEQEITVNKNKDTLLKVKINPEGVLPQKLSWSSDAGKNEYGYNVINFDVPYDEYCDSEICNINFDEVVFNANKAGKYTITVTTEDGLYSDSITVNVVQGVSSLSLNPDRNNWFSATLYIYMKESKYLDLNVKVYPEDATDKEIVYTSSDESIATVDQTGRVTAKRSGKVTITYKAKNYDVENTINVLIFDNDVSTKIGDVDGDGIVDILDLVKLRRHVAGVEEIQ